MKRLLLILVFPFAALAGSQPPSLMEAPVGSVVMPTVTETEAPPERVTNVKLGPDCIFLDGLPFACTPGTVGSRIAKINRVARDYSRAHPGSSECMAHFEKVRELAGASGWQVQLLQTSARAGSYHASAIVTVGVRKFWLDNGAAVPGAGAWLEITGVDTRDWYLHDR